MTLRRRASLNKLIRSKGFQHLLFWIFSFFVLYRLFRYSEQTARTDLVYTFLFHLSVLPVFYLNTEWLIPRFLRKSRYRWYILGVVGLLLLGTIMNYGTFRYWTNWIFPDYYFISYYTYWEILQFTGAYWAVSTLLTLSRSWYMVREQDKLILRLEQERTAAELRALKAQLDPHFLFNSLNGIYSLALYNDQKTPDAILKLSNTMRYLLYECQADRINLQREWDQVVDFLMLHEMRTPVELDLNIAEDLDLSLHQVPPLLILPLVENACKHGRPTPEGKNAIRVSLEQDDLNLRVYCANTYRKGSPQPENKAGGLGLVNFQKRLEWLFPNQFTLENNQENHWYSWALTFPLEAKKEL